MATTSDTWLELAGAPDIGGLRFRRPRGTDTEYEEIARVIGAASLADDFPWVPSAQMVRAQWEEDDRDEFEPVRDVVIVETDGRMVGVSGTYRLIRGGRAVYQLWGHIDPAWRGRGIGTALLGEGLRNADERARRHADPRERGRPIVRSIVSGSEAAKREVLSAAGLVPVRWSFHMRRPTLDDVPDAPLPDGLEVRPVEPDQHRAILLADNEAFRDHWEPRDLTESSMKALFEREDLRTELWVVAWDGNEVAGSVQSWITPFENERLGVRRGWLDSISVRRPWRRRGLARAMTAEALRRLKAAGMDEAMLGVDADNPTGALGLYEGLGFEVDDRVEIFGWPPDA